MVSIRLVKKRQEKKSEQVKNQSKSDLGFKILNFLFRKKKINCQNLFFNIQNYLWLITKIDGSGFDGF
ncbi:hypothetical protein BpHYR1_041121 [Brachionus plicatilis]|uniref:Uncharacterized protein n=1 Tax=Brachionus plicatilis TaxID=10195 RepID=A0A3M7S3R3_BRAPC|nr:hypothetical protein BpHYR1_041121 [Brachionus plicatilis]